MTPTASESDIVLLHAAGSLRSALTEVGLAFAAATGIAVQGKYGPSGLLKDEIAGGAKAEVFASANMEHPEALAKGGYGGPVILFARNRMCALVRPGLRVGPDDLLDHMLDMQVKLGTSTPVADPSGDYAWEIFRRAEAVRPGSFAVLDRKALKLTGGAVSAPLPDDRNPYGALVAEGKADIFLNYRTAVRVAARENPGQQVVELPAALAVGANYGMTVTPSASPAACRFAIFIMSEAGQRILAGHGFDAPALVERI